MAEPMTDAEYESIQAEFEWKPRLIAAEVYRLRNERNGLVWALRVLHDDIVDYITINRLGDPLRYQSIRHARILLTEMRFKSTKEIKGV